MPDTLPCCAVLCCAVLCCAVLCCAMPWPLPPAGPIDPYVVKSLMWQLLNGLSYLHQNWVIHRDLKVGATV
jgi:hypothetical protein